jgi:hypothetical protein
LDDDPHPKIGGFSAPVAQRRLLLNHALSFITSQLEFIKELVERDAEVASGMMLRNCLS